MTWPTNRGGPFSLLNAEPLGNQLVLRYTAGVKDVDCNLARHVIGGLLLCFPRLHPQDLNGAPERISWSRPNGDLSIVGERRPPLVRERYPAAAPFGRVLIPFKDTNRRNSEAREGPSPTGWISQRLVLRDLPPAVA